MKKYPAMKRSRKNEDYPSVTTWNYITIEGYCMLNTDFAASKNRYDYQLLPDKSFKRRKNDRYDPAIQPEPYPENCSRSIRSTCIGCRHFAWCDPDSPV